MKPKAARGRETHALYRRQEKLAAISGDVVISKATPRFTISCFQDRIHHWHGIRRKTKRGLNLREQNLYGSAEAMKKMGVKIQRRLAGKLAVLLLRAVRLLDPDRAANIGARIMRFIGPRLSRHQIGLDNLRHAYPNKSEQQRKEILLGVWDNLGRTAFEYAHMDRLWNRKPDEPGRVEFSESTAERFIQLRDNSKPALLFAAHLANWELAAIAATINSLEVAVLYRRPNFEDVANAVEAARSVNMGTLVPSRFDAGIKLAGALERGVHVGMLVDQNFSPGVDVTFFGRRCKANPLIARLAARYGCPIHGARAIRLPGNRFRVELTEAIPPVRSADGSVDLAATMQKITSIVEGWIREYPEQWLWLHQRWR